MQAPNPQQIVLLLLVAALVSMLAHRLKLPTSAGLMAAGLFLGLYPLHTDHIGLTRQVLLFGLLPALVFESALSIRTSALRTDWLPLLVLVTLGVGINLGVTALGMHYLIHWPWHVALLFGAITSATDPIAVLATFKQAGVSGRFRFLAEAESLLNDGVAVVAVGLVLLAAHHPALGEYAESAAGSLASTVIGGVAVGLVIGWLMTLLMGRSNDPLTETTLTCIGAYGAYYAADRLGGSGILATLTSGLVMGNVGVLGERYLTQRGREIVEALWEFAAFVANALVFLLMGFGLQRFHLRESLMPVLAGIGTAVAARALAVCISCGLIAGTRRRVPIALQHLLIWGGQRGALSLVLAVWVQGQGSAKGYELVGATAGLVAFSIFVQGLTFNPVLGHLIKRHPTQFVPETIAGTEVAATP